MGEYAEEYYRKEVKEKFGFDPGGYEPVKKSKQNKKREKCKKCGKSFVNSLAVANHIKDFHKTTKPQ